MTARLRASLGAPCQRALECLVPPPWQLLETSGKPRWTLGWRRRSMRRESRESRLAIEIRRSRATLMTSRVRTTPTRGQRVARESSPLAHFTSPRASVVRRSSVVWLDSVSTSSHQISPKSTSILVPRILIEQSNIAAMSHWFQQYLAIHRSISAKYQPS